MPHLSAEAKHHILLEYAPHDATRSFAALARRHAVRGGERVVRRWHQRWDGSPASLERKAGTGNARLLSRAQVQRHIATPIRAANRAHRAIHYTDLLPRVQAATGKDVSLRTVRRYGKEELGARKHRGIKRTAEEMDPALCEQIASLRRKLRHRSSNHVLFLDETALRLSAAPNTTIVLPGEKAYIVAEETSAYSKRFDMIACCVGDRVLLPKIFSPKERADAEVKGINGSMLLQFIDDVLAQAVEGLDRYPLTLVFDRAPIHKNLDAIRQAFHDRSSESIQDIILLPPNAAKRLSPLDNALFHDWKEECRKHCPVTLRTIQRVMSDAWMKMKPAAHYRGSGITRYKDPYFDCPAPHEHKHGS